VVLIVYVIEAVISCFSPIHIVFFKFHVFGLTYSWYCSVIRGTNKTAWYSADRDLELHHFFVLRYVINCAI